MTAFHADRFEEYARKGVELLLRRLGQSPEHRVARRLASRVPAAPTDGPRVLIVTPRDWVAHVQYEAMIAHALRARGARVSFLTCGGGLEICDRANTYESPPMPCGSCARYVNTALDAHGFPRRSLRDGWGADDALSGWPEIDAVNVDDLREVEIDGVALGAVVDIPVKWFLCAADLPGDPLVGPTSRAFLRSARRIAEGARRALDEVEPDIVVLLSGLFLFEGVVWELCKQRNIDVVTYERAFRKETLVFARGTPASYFEFDDAWALESRPLSSDEEAELDGYLEQRRKGRAFDQSWKFEETEVERGDGRLAVLFTNLTWDTAVIDRDCAFPDVRSWLEAAVLAFADRPAHRLVVRVHPSERNLPGKVARDSLEAFIHHRFPALPANVRVVGGGDSESSYPLMASADVGLVYTSTTGLELALGGTPVIVAGRTHYRGKGFTLDVSSPDDFATALDAGLIDPSSVRPDVAMARRYAHFFFFRAPVTAPFVKEPLRGLARFTTDDPRQFEPGVSDALDRICDGILLDRPFASG